MLDAGRSFARRQWVHDECDRVLALRTFEEGEEDFRELRTRTAPASPSPGAVDWARQHAGQLIDDITSTTRKQIGEIFAHVLDGSMSWSEATAALLDIFDDPDRVRMIARTESMTAVNAGQRDAWRQAADDGTLGDNARVVWITTPPDGRPDNPCDECEAMDGQTTGIDEAFDGAEGPPNHPNCRCCVGLVEGPTTATARILGGPGSGFHGHAGRPGEVGGSSAADEVPPLPGESPIPEGMVRRFHVTEEKNLESIREHGLTMKHAKGIEGPRAVYSWPDYQSAREYAGPEGNIIVEHYASKDAYKMHPYATYEEVPPEHIVAIHEPWHYHYRYAVENNLSSSELREVGGKDYNKAADALDRRAARLRSAGGPGSGNFGHAGRPGQVGGSSRGDFEVVGPGYGSDAAARAPITPEQIIKMHELHAQGIGNREIARRVLGVTTRRRVIWALENFNPDGTPRDKPIKLREKPEEEKKIEEPKPEEKKIEEPKPETKVVEPVKQGVQPFQFEPLKETSDPAAIRAEKLAQIDKMKAYLEATGITIEPNSYDKALNALNPANRQWNINTVHTSMESMIRSRQTLRNIGIEPPNTVMSFEPYQKWNPRKHALEPSDWAYATAQSWNLTTSQINVNLLNSVWQSRDELTRNLTRDAATYFHPTDNPDSIMTHEMGHVLHYRNVDSSLYNSPKWRSGTIKRPNFNNMSSREVSGYAKTNRVEFIAETFTGLVHGKTYSDRVMKMYKSLGGPSVPGKTR